MAYLCARLIGPWLFSIITVAAFQAPRRSWSYDGYYYYYYYHRYPSTIGSAGAGGVRTITTRRQGATTLEFKGESTSTTTIGVPSLPSSSAKATNKSLTVWMLSPELDPFILGTRDYKEREDGCFETYQKSIDWFNMELVPVFVMEVERSAELNQVSAFITEARSEIKKSSGGKEEEEDSSVTGRLVKKFMDGATFTGGSAVAWQKKEGADDEDIWTIKADLSLTLSIPLPQFLPLPPGFNTIGSRVVKSTCKSRLEKFVFSLSEAYLEWAEKE